jgi:hypothetical protein
MGSQRAAQERAARKQAEAEANHLRKRHYRSAAAARRVMRSIPGDGYHRNVYQCPICGDWLFGHAPGCERNVNTR